MFFNVDVNIRQQRAVNGRVVGVPLVGLPLLPFPRGLETRTPLLRRLLFNPVFLAVIKRTVGVFKRTGEPLVALPRAEHLAVVVELLPAVREAALQALRTPALFITAHIPELVPVRTIRRPVQRARPAHILRVVEVHAVLPAVLLRVRTGHRLVLLNVEVLRPLLQMQQLDLHFGVLMCEGTEAPVGTLLELVGEEGAVLGLEALRVVELLDAVVRVAAVLLAHLEWTGLGRCLRDAPFILLSVVVVALFRIMYLSFKRTRIALEGRKIQRNRYHLN